VRLRRARIDAERLLVVAERIVDAVLRKRALP
jgi:hypothetical protein